MTQQQRVVEIDQGDVFFVKMPIPKTAKKVERRPRGLVVAEGETTGHAHVIEADGATLYEEDGKLYLQVDAETVALDHEEHGTVTIGKGEYRVGIVREHDPFDEEVRRVRD